MAGLEDLDQRLQDAERFDVAAEDLSFSLAGEELLDQVLENLVQQALLNDIWPRQQFAEQRGTEFPQFSGAAQIARADLDDALD